MSKTLIVGSNGFIGRNFDKRDDRYIFLSRKNVNNKAISIDLSKDQINNLKFNFSEIGTIVHTAGISHHNNYSDSELLFLNNKITENVVNFFLNSNASKLVFLSSGKVYGANTPEPVKETSSLKPYDIIGKSKILQEDYLYKKTSDSKRVIICRLFNAYGLNQNSNFVIPKIKDSYVSRDNIKLGNIDVKRDFIYIDDVIRAIEKLISLKMSKNYEIFNICTQKGTSISEILEIFSSLLEKNIEIQIEKKLKRSESTIEVGSFEKIHKFTGWKPIIDIYQGIRKTVF